MLNCAIKMGHSCRRALLRPHSVMWIVVLASCWCDSWVDMSDASDREGAGSERNSVTLKIGALFDVRARHLVGVFRQAVEDHNKGGLHGQRSPGASEEDHNKGGLHGQRSPGASEEEGDHFPWTSGDRSVSVIFQPVITFVDVTDSFAVSNAMCDLIAHDVITIVGVTNASSLPTIQSYSATFHVPFLSLGSSQNITSPAPFQLSLRPPLMAAVVDLLQHQGCASALYMYDSDEGLMRIQDLFQAINIRELYVELDVRRIGDRAHVTEISKIIGSLHPHREMCLVLDVDRLDTSSIVAIVQGNAPTVKDILLVTLDAELALNQFTQDAGNPAPPRPFNISGLQLVPLPWAHPHTTQTPSSSIVYRGWNPGLTDPEDSRDQYVHHPPRHENIVKTVYYHHQKRDDIRQGNTDHVASETPGQHLNVKDNDLETEHLHVKNGEFQKNKPLRFRNANFEHTSDANHDSMSKRGPILEAKQGSGTGSRTSSSSHVPVGRSCEALLVDCLKVLDAAVRDVWESLGDVWGSAWGSGQSPRDMAIKCTNFVVDKKQHGADLMEALRLVHVQGRTGYIRFDAGGKREDFTLTVLALRAGTSVIQNEGEWSSVTGLTSEYWSRDGVRSYTIFGNISEPGRRVIVGVTE